MSEDKKEEVKPEQPGQSKSINIMDLPNVSCTECKGMVWEVGFVIKRLDTKQTGPKNVPIDVIMCKKCHAILQDGVPMLKPPTEPAPSK